MHLIQGDAERIARAADYHETPLTAFILGPAREGDSVVALSAEASRQFVKALDAPFRPNGKLRAALSRAKA